MISPSWKVFYPAFGAPVFRLFLKLCFPWLKMRQRWSWIPVLGLLLFDDNAFLASQRLSFPGCVWGAAISGIKPWRLCRVTSPRNECLSPAAVVGMGRGNDEDSVLLWVGAAVPLQTRAPGWWCKAVSPVPVCPWHGHLPGLWLLGSV